MSLLLATMKGHQLHNADQLTLVLCRSDLMGQFFCLAGLNQLSADKESTTYTLSLSTEEGTTTQRYRVLQAQQRNMLGFVLCDLMRDKRFVEADVRTSIYVRYIDRNKQPKYNIRFTWRRT